MARMSQQEKGRQILKDKTKYPDFNIMDYDASVRNNLSFYNLEIDNKLKKKYAIDYWKNTNKNVDLISQLNDNWFITVGAVAHLSMRGIELSSKHNKWLSDKFEELNSLAKSIKEDDTETPKLTISKEDKAEMEITFHIGELEFALDKVTSGEEMINVKEHLSKYQLSSAQLKKIAGWFKPRLAELKNTSDEQIVESYAFLGKKGLKKLIEAIELIISSCEVKSSTKVIRKTKTKKVKPPSVIVKNVKFLKEFLDLKMKSIPPEKLIGASEIWLYNVKLRRIFKYVSLGNDGISVKGTSLIGFDPEKSHGKIVRKPDEQLKGYESMTSRPMNKLYNDIKATTSKATGRLNEDSIILKIF